MLTQRIFVSWQQLSFNHKKVTNTAMTNDNFVKNTSIKQLMPQKASIQSSLSTTISVGNTTNVTPIGIFDSGVGGLSIANCIANELPHEQLIYIADNQFAPYGDKSTLCIVDRVNLIADYLIAQQAKALVIACNTATVNAIDQLRKRISIPVIGVEPAIKPAALHSKSKKVAILATQATATNNRFLTLVAKHSPAVDVIIQPCPGLVELIEQNKINSNECYLLLEQYLQPLLAQGIDTIVLGCTHYPFVAAQIKRIVGSKITIMETALPVTQELQRQLHKHQLLTSSKQQGNCQFIASQSNSALQLLINNLWQHASLSSITINTLTI